MMITLTQITEFFDATRADNAADASGWSIDAACRWSYYFLDTEQAALVALAKHLEAQGYEVVDIDVAETPGDYFLQVDCVETHTPESLFALGQSFDVLAAEFSVRDYDGMDVSGLEEDL